jgi:hypothetical protein
MAESKDQGHKQNMAMRQNLLGNGLGPAKYTFSPSLFPGATCDPLPPEAAPIMCKIQLVTLRLGRRKR